MKPDDRRRDILDGLAWLTSEMYDLNAKAEGNASFAQMAGPMLKMLLEGRCKLKVHRETKEGPVYFLTMVKGGKLQASKEGSCISMDQYKPPAPGEQQPKGCGQTVLGRNGLNETLDGYGLTMDAFAGRMSWDAAASRTVINKTGLAGSFDIHLEYVRGSGKVANTASDADGPSLFTAVQEQLGLKFVADKGPVEVLVIDHVERPSEN